MGVIITLAVVAFILVVTTLVISAVLCNLHRDQKTEDEEQMKFIESLKRKGKA